MMKETRFFVCMIALLMVATAARPGFTQDDDKEKLSKDVTRLFKAVCAQCHGPGGKKPKALKKWKNAADLQELIDRKYVVPGKPDDSDLIMILELGDMPPKGSKVPPLTKEQLGIVQAWVAGGAPVPKPQGTSDSADPASTESLGFISRTVRWIGKFHPVLVHFPVAFLMGAVMAELLGIWSLLGMKEHSNAIVRFCLTLGALGGVAAATAGWMNAEFTVHSGSLAWVLLFHRWLGTATAVVSVIAWIVLYRAGDQEGRSRRTFRILLFSSAAFVGAAGTLGGMLVYGIDHYLW